MVAPVKTWTPGRVNALRTLWASGLPRSMVAERINAIDPDRPPVTPSATKIKAIKLGVRRPEAPPSKSARPEPVCWTEERIAELTRLWTEGKYDYGVIAYRITRIPASGPPVNHQHIQVKARLLKLGRRIDPSKVKPAEPKKERVRATLEAPAEIRTLTPAEVDTRIEHHLQKVRDILRKRKTLRNIDDEDVFGIMRRTRLDTVVRGRLPRHLIRVQIGIVRAERCGMLEISA